MPSPQFELATLEVKKIKGPISDDDLLSLYAYFKVANKADFSQAKTPGTFDFKGKYKYKAWKAEVDAKLGPEEAEKKYIALVEKLIAEHGIDPAATKSANGEAISDADMARFDALVKETGKTY